MKIPKPFLGVSILLLIAVFGVAQSAADAHFTRGKELIEANGADAMGATRGGLERGIAEVREAIEKGYTDQGAAYKLLADAYNTLALVYAVPDSQEQKDIILLQKAALEKVIAMNPGDARARVEYGRVIGDGKLQIAALREIVANDPTDDGARFTLGMLLVDTGKADEGIKVLKEVVSLSGYERAQIYGRKLRQILIERGRSAEAAEISRQIQKKKPKPS